MKIIVSGMIFGSMHELAINYNWLIYCAMGWILGATYYWTKDLKCSMILHALINLF
ncbi:CPBP family intramembrane glutamic endopeptidase [Latilactobacillus sakei]